MKVLETFILLTTILFFSYLFLAPTFEGLVDASQPPSDTTDTEVIETPTTVPAVTPTPVVSPTPTPNETASTSTTDQITILQNIISGLKADKVSLQSKLDNIGVAASS